MLKYFISAVSVLAALTFIPNCKGNFGTAESFAPSNLPQAEISGITSNGGSSLYCSISGGCSLTITGINFVNRAKIFVGDFECPNVIINVAGTEATCTVGPAANGVYDVKLVNPDGKANIFAATVADPTTLHFSYASFLYLGSQESPGKVYGYAQHPTSGALLSIIGSPFSIAANNSTYGVVISPDNKFLYAANVSSGTVSIFSINPTNGKLTAVGVPVTSGGGSPNGLFFHPTGKYLYVTNQTGNSVSGFSVDSAGGLTALAGSPFATTGATTINGLVVSANGKFLYAAAMGGTGGVAGFSINELTGILTVIPGSPFMNTLGGVTTNTGDGISIHPNGNWLYMGLVGIRKIGAWSINQTTGVLTAIEAPILNNSSSGYIDNGGSASTVSDNGLFLYGTAFSTSGADPKKIVVYNINQSTGGLTRASDIDTGGGPNDVRIDTTGNFAYTCNSANPPSISAYRVDKTSGALSPLATRDYAIPTLSFGPGIMVMQRNSL